MRSNKIKACIFCNVTTLALTINLLYLQLFLDKMKSFEACFIDIHEKQI